MNNERSWRLLLRILSGRRRAKAYADAHDLAGLNNRTRGRRLVGDGAGGNPVVVRLAFTVHPETRLVKLRSGRLLRFSYYVWDCNRATTQGKICDRSCAKYKDACQQRYRKHTFENVARIVLRKQTQSPKFFQDAID